MRAATQLYWHPHECQIRFYFDLGCHKAPHQARKGKILNLNSQEMGGMECKTHTSNHFAPKIGQQVGGPNHHYFLLTCGGGWVGDNRVKYHYSFSFKTINRKEKPVLSMNKL